jgi:hypothetical protein
LSHDLHKPSSHVEHQDTAFTLSVLNWQGSQSFSDVVIACLSTMETIKLFSGKLFAHTSMLFSKSPSVTVLRQIGHLKLFFVLSYSTEDEKKVVIQDSQNVCKHEDILVPEKCPDKWNI